MLDPITIAALVAAFGTKAYGVKKQTDQANDVKRGRSRSFAAAAAKRKALADEALLKAKDTRSKFAKQEVDSAVADNTAQLTADFSQLPNSELSATAPPAHNEPSIITTASNVANEGVLKDIGRYAQDSAGMSALSSAFQSPEQMGASSLNRADIMDKARQQRTISQILGMEMDEYSNYSSDAEMAKGLGDILLAYGLGTV
jgi:hypothetical protein